MQKKKKKKEEDDNNDDDNDDKEEEDKSEEEEVGEDRGVVSMYVAGWLTIIHNKHFLTCHALHVTSHTILAYVN